MTSPISALPLPQICYHSASQDYYRPDDSGKWIRITETSAKRHLKVLGYSDDKKSDGSEVDQLLDRIQHEQNVGYASKLAGYDAGFCEINKQKVLVTESATLIEAKPGDWPLLGSITEGMLNVGGIDQRPYFYSWLKVSLKSRYDRKWVPGQVLAFAGPKNSAKSLIQSIITELLGGRSSKPYLFMTGRTSFNSDLFCGEHLMVEDECEYTDIKSRRHFGAEIKKVAVNTNHHCNGKNKDALLLTPWWRMTISLNDDPERLLVLPPIHDDIQDKIMLFKVGKREMPMPTETGEEQQQFWNALQAELPAFVYYLLHEYEIPGELRASRFGVKAFQHPDILLALEETSSELRFLEFIDKQIFKLEMYGKRPQSKTLTAYELEKELTSDTSEVKREANRLLFYDKACGVYLGRLATRPNPRVKKGTIVQGFQRWIISPPENEMH